MRQRLLQRYILGAIFPYFLLALLLLTGTLFAQQFGRLAEALTLTRLSAANFRDLGVALLPSVLAFTVPTSLLAGVLIGFSRMGSDSELVAMRSAGIGTIKLVAPVVLLGLFFSAIALYINIELAPAGAQKLRLASVRAALQKLDSPVDPRTFNTEIPGYVFYVREGDKEAGQWGRVFLYAFDATGSKRLVTSRSGRIDSSPERSELVLQDAVSTTLPAVNGSASVSYVMERLSQLRVVLETGRQELLRRLGDGATEPEEMGIQELSQLAASDAHSERLHASIILHKRLALSLAPLLFALLGSALGLRVRKGGRGLGVMISLVVLIGYYLISLLGEQMGKTGAVSPIVGAWIANVVTFGTSLVMLRSSHRHVLDGVNRAQLSFVDRLSIGRVRSNDSHTKFLVFPSMLDRSVLQSLAFGFVLALLSFSGIFLLFTLFELWRFIVETGASASLVASYFLHLLPFVSVQLFPPSLLVAVLLTYALMARRSEAVAWWACGQSIFRLAVPALFFAFLAGIALWLIQERMMPDSNVRQDAIRAQIRGGATRARTREGKQWLASLETNRIYEFEYGEDEDKLLNMSIFEFDEEGMHLDRVLTAKAAAWTGASELSLRDVETLDLRGAEIAGKKSEAENIVRGESREIFRSYTDKPSQLNSSELRDYIEAVKRRGGEASPLVLALQRKYAEPFSLLVMTLVGIPMALAFGRRSAIVALCSAIAIGLGYWAVSSGIGQLGSYGLLPAAVAAWAPTVVFAAGGTYLLSRSRT